MSITKFLAAMNKDHTIIAINFSDDVLDQVAELEGLEVRLLDLKQTLPYKIHADDLYEQFNAR
jgi:hypothetical protein